MNGKIIHYLSNNNIYIKEFVDDKGKIVRTIGSDSAIYSASYLDSNELYFPYYKLYDIPAILNKDCSNFLMLGAGCFSYPKYFISTYLNKSLDAVEIDKEIVDVTYTYFGLKDLIDTYDKDHKRLKIYLEDAYKYVSNCTKKYDIIFQDTFIEDKPIKTFLSKEYIVKIDSILKDKGIYSINYIVRQGKKEVLLDYINNLESSFKYVNIITLNNYFKNGTGNIFILCSNHNYSLDSFKKNIIYLNKTSI